MNWLTPRRRFLMTVPLALLLPSGLLTYLGLQMVSMTEDDYREQAVYFVERSWHTIRNETTEKLDQLLLNDFLPAMNRKLQFIQSNIPLPADFHFELPNELEYADRVFILLQNEQLYFFERVHSGDAMTSGWKLTRDVRATFEGYIKTKILLNTKSSNAEYEPFPPDRRYEKERELAAFTIRSVTSRMNIESSSANPAAVEAVGFTFDFDYINHQFFQSVIEDLWSVPTSGYELRYPVMIYDVVTEQRVAEPSMIGAAKLEVSTEYSPKFFHDKIFPWYQLQYSKETGQDYQQIADTARFIYYCLIASANIIMIVAIIGSIRNINQELILSDMRSDFVARVSHELRTPLGLIRLYSETLEMGRTKDPTKQNEYLHAITKESERLTHLINNVLNFSQIEARRKQYKLVNMPIRSVVEEAVDSIQYHLERKDFSIDVNIQPDLPVVMCDSEAMELALYNLLSNAMKYSGENKKIELSVQQEGNEVVLEVKDYGIGIPKELQKKIFQEFYRIDDPVVRSTGGSGLGLAVTRHIVEGHQGKITVDSQAGEGSVFRIHLPTKQSKQQAMQHA